MWKLDNYPQALQPLGLFAFFHFLVNEKGASEENPEGYSVV